ncbi:pseudouridine synthase [Spirosoma humi]
MSQDSEQNDRGGRPSRDGDPQRRDGRSFGRRDDARTSGPTGPRANTNRSDDRPRFSRDNDRPKLARSADSDRPRFNRDNRDSGPRDSARNDGPRFDRGQNDRPKFNRPADGDRSRFSRDNDRPRFNRAADGDRTGGSSRDTDRPKFNRPADGDRPRFNRDDRTYRPAGAGPRSDKPAGAPRFNREDRPDQRNRDADSPRFSNDRGRSNDRFGSDRPKREERPDGDRPRINRGDFPRTNDRRSDTGRTGSSRFSREGGSARPDKPAFKRVGGFSREADERNRFGNNDQSRDNRRNDGPRNDGPFQAGPRNDQDRESRFTGKQRKESGDRRTGNYTKAPDYNLEQTRAADTFKRNRSDDKRQSDQNDGPGATRLNRYIANSGVCSRREADELIARGDISVNGKVVTEMGYKVKEGDTVKYGTKVLNPERFVYVLLNKPKDYITTTEDPEERKTVMELVADAGNFRMYPVGRLDRNTTGLLLVTNDGELADKLTHPSNNIRKIYQVELDKPITEEHLTTIKKGIELEDGPIKPDAVSIVTPDAYVVGIEIHSGRNRIVRRIFESLGYEVTKLDRTTYAGLTKKELPRGKWRFLDPKEVVKLKYLNS